MDSEYFLFMLKGNKHLILWGTGYGSRGEEYGRVVKIPIEQTNVQWGRIEVPDYNSIFFNLKEKSYISLFNAGLLR